MDQPAFRSSLYFSDVTMAMVPNTYNCRGRDRKKRTAARFANQPFVGNVQVIADKRTPYRTLSEVIYTLGQTEFKNLRFVVNKKTQ